jgi:magnesium transporter
MDAALYRDGKRLPDPFVLDGARHLCDDPHTFAWIGLYEPTEEEFEAVTKEFNLHPLAVEDAIMAHQRPKLDVYENTLFVVLKPARYVDPEEAVELGEILLFVDERFVVAVRHGEASKLVAVRKALESQPEKLSIGSSAVLLAILDQVVDDYSGVLDGLEGDIRELEDEVFSENGSTPTQRIYKLKREVLQFHQATAPLVDPIQRLANQRFPAVNPELREYFTDVHDHLERVVEKITGFRDLLTSVLEANLTQVSVRQNNDMRKISAWVAIAAVPTAMAGIWGMNFDFMPELGKAWGYPLALILMVAACATLFRKFKKSGWL